jgi:hypothetical protein
MHRPVIPLSPGFQQFHEKFFASCHPRDAAAAECDSGLRAPYCGAAGTERLELVIQIIRLVTKVVKATSSFEEKPAHRRTVANRLY